MKRRKDDEEKKRRDIILYGCVCVCAFYASDGAFISRQRRAAFLGYDTSDGIYTLRRVDIIMTMIASNSGYYICMATAVSALAAEKIWKEKGDQISGRYKNDDAGGFPLFTIDYDDDAWV